jgi:hypothetical protein
MITDSKSRKCFTNISSSYFHGMFIGSDTAVTKAAYSIFVWVNLGHVLLLNPTQCYSGDSRRPIPGFWPAALPAGTCPEGVGLGGGGAPVARLEFLLGSADRRISGGWCSHGGAEARREQREESTTGPGGQLACLVLLPVMLGDPWLPTTEVSTRAPVIHPVRVHK